MLLKGLRAASNAIAKRGQIIQMARPPAIFPIKKD
jgi:hypothetical protein